MVDFRLPIGAQPDAEGVYFRVWAASARQVEVVLFEGDRAQAAYPLAPEQDGYFAAHIAGVRPGARYMYRLDGGDTRPDPAARAQPDGVHGPSQVVDPAAFRWTDAGWRGVALEELVIYEVHVGTATTAGTFDALIERLDDIRALGANAVELLPIADFPGARNWGYDGVCLFAPARAYGGPEALRRLVDAAHARGLAVLLDVVYNHLGPDGNYLRQFSESYFTSRHSTPWGEALNVDGPGSRPVRDFFIANARHWAAEYHIDGLRLDATHAIIDDSPLHLLTELAEATRAQAAGRHFLLIAENEHNDPNLVRPRAAGGIGLDGVWADDFHHQVRVGLTGEDEGYYGDYSGSAADLAATLRQGWFYTGQPSGHLGRPRGAPADDVAPPHFIYCIQNHDQIGNRALGERLSQDVPPAAYRAASALLLLLPYTPLLFMGQEWAASTPFLYFTDHHDELGRLVTEGRRAEFAHFSAFSGEQVPDPQAAATFEQSKLRWDEREQDGHVGVLRLYRDLLGLRARLPALRARGRESLDVLELGEGALAIRRSGPAPADTLLLVVGWRGPLELDLAGGPAAPPGQRWELLLDSEDARYGGAGAIADAGALRFEGARAVLLGLTAA